MFSTKGEVNKHVENCLKKINSDVERNLRCFAFAKLYMQINEWELALRYINIYLSANATSPDAHRARAQIFENLGKKSQALEAYILSLDLDPKQNHLISKICDLMSREETNFDSASARYFVERAQNLAPGDPSIMRLKERLVASSGKDPDEVTNFFLKELETRPLDVDTRIRLLRHLLQHNNVKEAYTHAYDIEQKAPAVFSEHLAWYETLTLVLSAYRESSNIHTWDFWMMNVSVWDKVVTLSLNERTRAIDCAPLILKLDEALQLASDKTAHSAHKQLNQEFWRHYSGQLCWHLTTYLYKQARKELVKYREASAIGIPLLFASYHFRPADLHGLWLEHAPAQCRSQMQRWNRDGAFRCSQAGCMLQTISHERKTIVLEKATHGTTGLWREKTFKFLFVMREHQSRAKTAFFVVTDHLLDILIHLPDKDELLGYTQTAQLVYPDSLHHHIWLGMNVDLVDFECASFAGLPYTMKNLKNCAAETLNILDIQSFIYAAILCHQTLMENQKVANYSHPEKPALMPAACTDLMGSVNQRKWLKCVHLMFMNKYSTDVSEMRVTLIRGIETVRCSGNHGLDTVLLVQLARLFGERAERVTSRSEVEANEARAELYWSTAMHLLEKFKKSEAISYACNRIFDCKFQPLTRDQLLQAINDGKLFLGKQAMKRKEYERACHYFKDICDPNASFHLAQIYKTMAEKETNQKQSNVTSEMRSRNFTLMTKARDSLYVTLDRLGMPGVDAKHPLNKVLGSEIEKIERMLSRIDPDNNRNECDGMSDENVSSADSDNFNYSTLPRSDFIQMQSTPYREARPSPERLDAQIRQLMATKDATLTRVLDTQKALNDDLKQSMNTVVSQLSDIKRTVDELESLRNVADVVVELRKEMSEVKKDIRDLQKSKVASADALFGLDDDYPSDFSSAPAVSSLYPGRMSNLPAPIMYPGNPYGFMPSMYPYANIPGMTLPSYPLQQAQTLPMDNLADLRALNLLSAGLTPSPSMNQSFNHAANFISQYPFAQQTVMDPVAPTMSSAQTTSVSVTKTAPVNVVITSSDPLPPPTSTHPPLLPITIPQQHLRGNKAHNFQIPVTSSVPSTAPSVPTQTPLVVSTESLFSNVAAPVYSALTTSSPKSSTALGLQIEKSLNHSFNKSAADQSGEEEHDPCPNYKPIIPMPDEVTVTTGEEDEEVLFKDRAMLYRYVDNVWKERGCGDLKILRNTNTLKIRILMRREQVLNICANHFLTADMKINPKQSNERAYTWGAVDFADGTSVVERFCAQFRTAEQGLKFCNAFEMAQRELRESEEDAITSSSTLSAVPTFANLGGFTFTSTPAFKPKEDDEVVVTASQSVQDTSKAAASPFASFTFSTTPPKQITTTQTKSFMSFTFTPTSQAEPAKTISTPVSSTKLFGSFNSSLKTTPTKERDADGGEEFVPTAEFKPVVPLPDLIEVKTGEEHAEILFESKAKLFRHDATAKEWKERGLGQMKVLKDGNILRLVMRREQIHKVCCNHQILKTMNFTRNEKAGNSVNWAAKDFSEGVLVSELFAVRFKTEELARKFENIIRSHQKQMLDDHTLSDGTQNRKEPSVKSDFGDAFKAKPGDWECKNCLIRNVAKVFNCVACDTPKSGVAAKSAPDDGNKFCFGVGKAGSPGFAFGGSSGFGDAFKPKAGSWECKECYTRNDSDKGKCLSCETPKEGHTAITTTSGSPRTLKGVDLSTGGLSFKFGVSPVTSTSTPNKDKDNVEELKVGGSLPFNFKPTATGVFGSPHKVGFEFTPRSPRRQSSGPSAEDEGDNSYYEDEEANVYFKPVIPLPDKIVVTTGEEDEAVLYSHRARLYRLVTGEWKERGTGDIKILLNESENKLRVLMRREQVHKICLNHILSSTVQYTVKDERSWLFTAPDFSEGVLEYSSFCLRFKNSELATQFLEAVKSAVQSVEGDRDDHEESDSDVEFVCETTVSEAEEQEARRLMLPPKFMAYRKLDDCKCAQCLKEDQMFAPNLSFTSSKSTFFSCATPTTTSQTSFFGTPSKPSSPFSFASFGSNSGTLNTPKALESQTLKDLLMKPSLLSKSSSSDKFFGSPSTLSTTSTPENKLFSFANTPKTSQKENESKSTFSFAAFGSGEAGSPAVLGDCSNISFASLAANADSMPFGKPKEKVENPFATLGAGAPVFGAPANKSSNDADAEDGDGDHDPHYEPIVPLPDEIVVQTGEEDEETVFSERAKLYRFANKQWKERGVGNIKLLYHPQNNTYRLLLRREAVHKIVLNQRITPDLNIQAFTMSSNAWMWAGMNFGEDGHQLEKLAVRFKYESSSQQFYAAIQKALEAIIHSANNSRQDNTVSDEGDVEEEDGKYDYDEERSVLFSCEAFLYAHDEKGAWTEVCDAGLTEIVYDYYSARIMYTNANKYVLSNTLIAANTKLERLPDSNGLEFQWRGVEADDDDAKWRDLKLAMYTEEDANVFYAKYLEAHAYAEEANIVQETGSEA